MAKPKNTRSPDNNREHQRPTAIYALNLNAVTLCDRGTSARFLLTFDLSVPHRPAMYCSVLMSRSKEGAEHPCSRDELAQQLFKADDLPRPGCLALTDA